MRPERDIGGDLAPDERFLLELLCQGKGPGFVRAREQLLGARWGGYQFDECECFLIAVPRDQGLLPIPPHEGGPFSQLEVFQDGECLGHLDLWVIDGYLDSVDYMPFGDDFAKLPDPVRFTFEGID